MFPFLSAAGPSVKENWLDISTGAAPLFIRLLFVWVVCARHVKGNAWARNVAKKVMDVALTNVNFIFKLVDKCFALIKIGTIILFISL